MRNAARLSTLSLALVAAACSGSATAPSPGGDDATSGASNGGSGSSGAGSTTSSSGAASGSGSGSSGASGSSSGSTASGGSSGSASSSGAGGSGGTDSGRDGAGTEAGGSSSGASTSSSGADASGSSGSSGSSASSGSSSGSSSSSGGSSSGSDASTPYDFSVLQHHKNPSRNGVYIEPTFTKTSIATMHKTTIMGTVSTQVYAQPLYVENGPGGVPAFIVATEENHVTAINATTGATIWDTGPSVLGTPVSSGLMCGDISPVGVTGTPIIDEAAGVIYLDAMTTVGGTVKHRAFALNLSSGTVLTNWPVDISAKITSFVSRAQNERGALQLVGGTLFIPFGGHDGDCDTYNGWVVGIPVASPQSPISWHTTATQAGIWGPGSLPTDGTSIFPVTGNTFQRSPTPWGQSEAILRLGTSLTYSSATADIYYPSNWQALDIGDTDLGGGSDVLFDMPGTAHPHLVAQGGKDSHLYLLDRDSLGGMAGELLNKSVATNQVKGAPAVYATGMGTYVALHIEGGTGSTCPNGGTGNIIAVKITPGPPIAASVAWCSTKSGLASPMVTTTDGTNNAVVWAANNALWGFDGDTGALLAGATSGTNNTSIASTIQGWNLPISAHGKMALGNNGELYVFTP